MLKYYLKIVGLLICLACALPLCAAAERQIVVAAWNVENLFDIYDDPDTEGDDAYTPAGWVHWTQNRYKTKLSRIASVIADINPDILCLSEVENKRVLRDLVQLLAEDYKLRLDHIVHRDGEDFRGIDVAILARYEPDRKCWTNAVSGQRDILACHFNIDGKELIVIANHWKSKLGAAARSDSIREREAKAVRAYIKRELTVNSDAAILVAGDFNSDIDSAVLTETAGFLIDLNEIKKTENTDKLYNLAAGLDEDERGTYYYFRADRWNSFDSISVTRGMIGIEPLASWQVKRGSYKVYKSEKVTFKGVGTPLPFRRIRSKQHGDRFVEGYSDHFAVYVTLSARK